MMFMCITQSFVSEKTVAQNRSRNRAQLRATHLETWESRCLFGTEPITRPVLVTSVTLRELRELWRRPMYYAGKVTTKQLRPSSMDLQRASPPWWRAICRTNANPSPVPPRLPAPFGR